MKKKSRIVFALMLGFLWSASLGLVALIAWMLGPGQGINNIIAAGIAPVILSIVVYFLSFMIWDKED